MKRIIVLILILITCMVIFVGCGVNNDVSKARFAMINNSISMDAPGTLDGAYLLADRETGVVYLYTCGYGTASITALLNADGTPMIYDFNSDKIMK